MSADMRDERGSVMFCENPGCEKPAVWVIYGHPKCQEHNPYRPVASGRRDG